MVSVSRTETNSLPIRQIVYRSSKILIKRKIISENNLDGTLLLKTVKCFDGAHSKLTPDK